MSCYSLIFGGRGRFCSAARLKQLALPHFGLMSPPPHTHTTTTTTTHPPTHKGWVGAKLRVRPSSVISRVEVLGPGSGAFARSAKKLTAPGSAKTVQVLPPLRSAGALPSGRS